MLASASSLKKDNSHIVYNKTMNLCESDVRVNWAKKLFDFHHKYVVQCARLGH
jgi:hypothetical protein